MRYFVISDIHGNLEAFKAVLKASKKEKFDRVIFLGDVVGYGADPVKVCKLLKEMDPICVMGNHDASVLNPKLLSWFNPYARFALEWTAEHLTEECKNYMRQFPEKARLDDMLIVHSNPYKPQSWEYILSRLDALFYFQRTSEKVILFGHTHIPVVYEYNPEEDNTASISPVGREIQLDIENMRYMLNPGSVGQPRDNDPRAAYGILDTDKWTFTVKRVDYNIEKAAQKIIEAGLPQFLAHRLYTGE